MPSVGQTDAGAEGAPLEVAERPAMEAIPLPMLEWAKLPLALCGTVCGGRGATGRGPTDASGGGRDCDKLGAGERSRGGARGSSTICATGGPGDGARRGSDGGGHGCRVPEHHGSGGED